MANQKQCKQCMEMIHENASICPHCRKRQPTKITLFKMILFGLFCFIVYSCVASMSSVDQYKEKAKANNSTRETEALTEKGKKIKVKHPGWDNAICNSVAEKKIYIGMTTDQVRAAWGRPYTINTTTGSYGTHEQWVMHEMGNDYVYFENGIMTSLQQSK